MSEDTNSNAGDGAPPLSSTGAQDPGAAAVVTTTYTDGSSATGLPPLPEQSPAAVEAPADAPTSPVQPTTPPKRARVRRQGQTPVLDPITAVTTERTVVNDGEEALPTSVKLAAPYSFYDDEGSLHSWAQGQIVEDAGQIELLIDRGAIFEAA